MTGFLVIDKPDGITSFKAVAIVRRLTGEKKIGHCGTLDPMATGVLPIMLGGATRFLQYLPDHTKAYRATMRLGLTTDTLDITGTVTEEKEVHVTKEDVIKFAEQFKGDIMQIPPMYSAIKKDGVRMYDLARKGIEVEREPRHATISKFEIEKQKNNDYTLYIECSSGTYIRTLIDDIGKKLGCGAIMTELRREMAAGFELKNAITLDALESLTIEEIESNLTSVEDALHTYESLVVTASQAKRFQNGGALNLDRIPSCKVNGLYRVFDPDKNFLGLAQADTKSGVLKAERIFVRR